MSQHALLSQSMDPNISPQEFTLGSVLNKYLVKDEVDPQMIDIMPLTMQPEKTLEDYGEISKQIGAKNMQRLRELKARMDALQKHLVCKTPFSMINVFS